MQRKKNQDKRDQNCEETPRGQCGSPSLHSIRQSVHCLQMRQVQRALPPRSRKLSPESWACGPECRVVSKSWIVSELERSRCGCRGPWISLSRGTAFAAGARMVSYIYSGYVGQVNLIFKKLRKLSQWFRRYLKRFLN